MAQWRGGRRIRRVRIARGVGRPPCRPGRRSPARASSSVHGRRAGRRVRGPSAVRLHGLGDSGPGRRRARRRRLALLVAAVPGRPRRRDAAPLRHERHQRGLRRPQGHRHDHLAAHEPRRPQGPGQRARRVRLRHRAVRGRHRRRRATWSGSAAPPSSGLGLLGPGRRLHVHRSPVPVQVPGPGRAGRLRPDGPDHGRRLLLRRHRPVGLARPRAVAAGRSARGGHPPRQRVARHQRGHASRDRHPLQPARARLGPLRLPRPGDRRLRDPRSGDRDQMASGHDRHRGLLAAVPGPGGPLGRAWRNRPGPGDRDDRSADRPAPLRLRVAARGRAAAGAARPSIRAGGPSQRQLARPTAVRPAPPADGSTRRWRSAWWPPCRRFRARPSVARATDSGAA